MKILCVIMKKIIVLNLGEGVMKKALLIIVSIAFLLGIGYAGYVVFNSKNVVSVEVEGQIQTLYFVNETDKPNFQDAKLKVNYKSGDAKFISFEKADIEVNDFSTTDEASKTMKITYKNQLLTIDYNVIRSGLYYLSGTEKSTLVSGKIKTTSSSYKINDVNQLYYFDINGSLKYYSYDSSIKQWILFDGKYNKEYKYEIKNNTLSVYLGGNTPIYQLQANKNADNDEKIDVKSTSYTYSGEFQTSKTIYDFTHYDMKTNVKIDNLSVYCPTMKTNQQDFEYLEMNVGETFSNTNQKIFFKITYSDSWLDVTDSNDNIVKLLKTVYVYIDDGMVKDNTLDTSSKNSPILSKTRLAYDGELCEIYYTVVG